jgi:hypothetical protein
MHVLDMQKKMKMHYVVKRLLPVLLLPFVACSKSGESSDDVVPVAVYGDETLTYEQVLSSIPSGLESSDSLALFNAIVDNWIEERLLRNLAEENIEDPAEIERMVEDYRRELVVTQYRRKMKEDSRREVSDKEVRTYYDRQGDNMRLEHPLIKGIYIKIPEDAEQRDDVRRWIKEASSRSADRLEKYGLKGAMQYDWFMDKWVDWQVIADQIPYRFGNSDEFVKDNNDFELTLGGSTYLLHISDRLLSGDKMPYEFAAPIVRETLLSSRRAQYERSLLRSLYNKALKEGKLQRNNQETNK